MKKFITYGLGAGQGVEKQLDYAPLPASLLVEGEGAAAEVHLQRLTAVVGRSVEASATVSGGRSVLERSPLHRLPGPGSCKWGLSALAAGVLILIAYFFVRLIGESSTAFSHIGVFNFFFRNNWDVSQLQQGAACTTASIGALHVRRLGR